VSLPAAAATLQGHSSSRRVLVQESQPCQEGPAGGAGRPPLLGRSAHFRAVVRSFLGPGPSLAFQACGTPSWASLRARRGA